MNTVPCVSCLVSLLPWNHVSEGMHFQGLLLITLSAQIVMHESLCHPIHIVFMFLSIPMSLFRGSVGTRAKAMSVHLWKINERFAERGCA